MPRVRTNGIEIEYETFGHPTHAPLLRIIERMGHELPPEAWPRVIDAISRHVRKACGSA